MVGSRQGISVTLARAKRRSVAGLAKQSHSKSIKAQAGSIQSRVSLQTIGGCWKSIGPTCKNLGFLPSTQTSGLGDLESRSFAVRSIQKTDPDF